MSGPSQRLARARERLTFARIWDKTRRRAVGRFLGRGEITLIGLRKLALQLTLGGTLAGLAATESGAQWGWTTPASPAPQAQAPASTPPQGVSRGENFSAGKPAAQLFASDCTGAGCHKGPQGLARDRGAGSLASFLREHYTNSRESASALAAYLVGVPGAARADPKQQQPRAATRTDEKPAERRPPAAIPVAPSGETGEPAAKPAPAVRAQRGRQAIAPAQQTPPPAVTPAPAPEPPAPAVPPEPPKPQWDIFD